MITADVMYTEAHMRCYIKALRKPTDFIHTIVLALCGCNAVYGLIYGTKYLYLNILILLCVLFDLIQSFRLRFTLPKKAVEKQKRLWKDGMHFAFTEDGFEIHVEQADDLYRWEEIPKAVCVDGCFCIFVTPKAPFMVMAHELQGGTAGELTELLRQKLGNRLTVKQSGAKA